MKGVKRQMDNKKKDDVFYVCTLIEFIARKTKNHRKDVAGRFTKEEIEHQLDVADLNHCLSFEQVSDELVEEYGIPYGTFDTVSTCKYNVPSVTSIGRVYQRLVLSVAGLDNAAQGILDVFSSFISDEISNFNTSVYYSNPDYLRCCYEDGYLLD